MLVVGLVRFQLMISGNAANVAGKAAVSTTLAASRGWHHRYVLVQDDVGILQHRNLKTLVPAAGI